MWTLNGDVMNCQVKNDLKQICMLAHSVSNQYSFKEYCCAVAIDGNTIQIVIIH